jgi:hypothetical protein
VVPKTEFNGICGPANYIRIVPICAAPSGLGNGRFIGHARDRCRYRRCRRSNCACSGMFTLGVKSKELTLFNYASQWRKANMQITVVALMCHTLASIPQPVCREEIVVKDEMPMQACMLSQPAIADWKRRSMFSGDQWNVARIKCVPGDYVLKGAA